MKRNFSILSILILLPLLGFTQVSQSLCSDLETLVDELIPEDFPNISYETSTIVEVSGSQEFRRLNYSFLGVEKTYYDPETKANKRFLAYPFVGIDKETAAKLYLEIVQSFGDCELVYTSFAATPNPNIGMLATHTIGIDRRFFNSNISLFQYASSDSSRYWIEYELTAPK